MRQPQLLYELTVRAPEPLWGWLEGLCGGDDHYAGFKQSLPCEEWERITDKRKSMCREDLGN